MKKFLKYFHLRLFFAAKGCIVVKKMLWWSFVFFCVFMLFCTSAVFGETIVRGDITYDVSDGEATAVKCSISATNALLEEQINGAPVTAIGDSAFENCASLLYIEIPKSVTRIGDRAFYGCKALRSFSLPENLEYLGEYAFAECESFDTFSVPSKITSLGNSVFIRCKKLYELNLPYGLLSIGERAFCGCVKLSSIIIPESVYYIGNSAFLDCKELKNIEIPEGVTALYSDTFYGCCSLKKITLPKSLSFLGDRVFYDCNKLEEISLSVAASEIGEEVFGGACGIYVVFYDGKETQWNKITINLNNENFFETEKVFNAATEERICKKEQTWEDIGDYVIFSSYDGDVLLDAQAKIYKGKPLTYAPVKGRTSIKLFIWSEDLQPRDIATILE